MRECLLHPYKDDSSCTPFRFIPAYHGWNQLVLYTVHINSSHPSPETKQADRRQLFCMACF